MQSDLPDLVADSQIRVEFKGELVRRFIYGSDIANGKFQRRKETVHFWEAEEELGRGAYGSVWLHRCLTSEDQAEVQAVKKLKKRVLSSAGISFVKELETIAKFSQRKVGDIHLWLLPRSQGHFNFQPLDY